MENKASMTALVSAFARWHHAAHSAVPVFCDSAAGLLLTDAERAGIGARMAGGAGFFLDGFSGTADEALRRIVDEQLAPSPLGRAAFAEEQLALAASEGARQYLILAAGYDTFAWRRPDWARELRVFELDLPGTAADKRARLARAGLPVPAHTTLVSADLTDPRWPDALLAAPGFDPGAVSFCSLLGVSYYMEKKAFSVLLTALSDLLSAGSRIVFDYPDEDAYTDKAGPRAKKQALLARGAGEPMRASYAAAEMDALLAAAGFDSRMQLRPADITARFFSAHNAAEPAHPMAAFDNVNYCLAEKMQ